MDKTLQEKAKDLKLLVLDLDGCLTDGKYYTANNGLVMKSFNTKDFEAMERFLESNSNVEILILTSSVDECVAHKMDGLWYGKNIRNRITCKRGVPNKLDFVNYFRFYVKKSVLVDDMYQDVVVEKYDFDQIAYFGDSWGDLECMKLATITGCPLDAIYEIKEESTFISGKKGGDGCVADFIQYLMDLVSGKRCIMEDKDITLIGE